MQRALGERAAPVADRVEGLARRPARSRRSSCRARASGAAARRWRVRASSGVAVGLVAGALQLAVQRRAGARARRWAAAWPTFRWGQAQAPRRAGRAAPPPARSPAARAGVGGCLRRSSSTGTPARRQRLRAARASARAAVLQQRQLRRAPGRRVRPASARVRPRCPCADAAGVGRDVRGRRHSSKSAVLRFARSLTR